ncbi:MAG: hypothetical protein P9E88_17665 [Candidatus Competibacter sp.]|jgi:hypothetical protein|nr:hypothetical protein [Candidatus Competibacter sp.]
MSTIENYLSTIRATNDRMWAQVKPLEKQLHDLNTEYQAAIRRPITDVVSRGAAALLLSRINATVAKINAAYDDWQRTLSLITPPPPTINPNTFPPPRSPGKLSDKIPWPKDVPLEVRRQLGRVIDQGGIPLSKRVAVTVAKAPYGGGGVVIEFAKW